MNINRNKYFEKLEFDQGIKINISNKVNETFSDTHWHPFMELILSFHDNTEVTINFTSHTLKANDLVLIYPGELHSLNINDRDSCLIIQFPIDILLIMNEFNSTSSVFYQYHTVKYDSSNIDSDKMVVLLKEMESIYYSSVPFKEVQIYSNLLDFFIKFCEHCFESKKKSFPMEYNTHAEPKSIQLMAEACLYISQNCINPLTLEGISKHIGFSRFHFSHIFKSYTGMTFIDFLTSERIKKAETLLSNSQTAIIDIAFNSGFSSVSSFNRAFKNKKGVSPSEFRKMLGTS